MKKKNVTKQKKNARLHNAQQSSNEKKKILDNVLHEDDEFREWVRNSCVRSTLLPPTFKATKKKYELSSIWLVHMIPPERREYVFDLATTQLTED